MSARPVAVVSGGTYGIGRGITLELARRGHHVVAFGLDARQPGSASENGRAGTRQELDRHGLEADLLEADVSSTSAVSGVAAFVTERYGRLDAVVNAAAIRPAGSILDTDEETWQRTLDVNLSGAYRVCRALIPLMAAGGGGAIVNIGSASGWGRPGYVAYCASKGGLLALTMALAHELRPLKIRSNLVIPGGVVTGMSEGDESARAAIRRGGESGVAGRPLLPADVGAAVAFLVSGEAAQVTGTVLDVGSAFLQATPAQVH